MASYLNPMSALSMYGGSPYGQSSGYQSSLAPAYSPYDQQDPYAAMAPYGQDALSADQDPLAMLMSMLAPPPPPPPPVQNGDNEIIKMVLQLIMMLVGQQGKGNDCQPCQKKQQRSNDYGPQPQASNPSYAQYPDSQYAADSQYSSTEPDYTSVLNGSENPYEDHSTEHAQTTYVPEESGGAETELTGNSTDDGGDPFADSGDGF
ncbi:MAG: hypothetical protein QE263_05105 [Vampirovibrionales bacterium]|nr:hypothetical protein [Vampirovibrionales bacterium]